MQVFKCALSLVFRNPTLLLIYTVGLGFMGVLMGSSITFGGEQEVYERPVIDYAIIDRDDSALSTGIADFLATRGEKVDLEDSRQALQDCVAKGEASYVLIIPEGYEEDLVDAIISGTDLPEMEAVYSFYAPEGLILDSALADYLSAVSAYMALQAARMPGAIIDVPDASIRALAAVSQSVDVQILSQQGSAAGSDRFCFYLQFSIYAFFASIIACLGMLLSNLNRADMRKRSLASPISYTSYTMQVGLACLLVTCLIWAFIFALGLLFFSSSAAAIAPLGLALMAITAFMLALVALSIAFLIGQAGMSGTGANAIGNILGLVISFMGGSWIPLSLASPEVDAIAHFLPGFWYTDALSKAAHISEDAFWSISAILADIGILLLFAVAIFCIGLLTGKLRMQTSSAGGNAAAALPSVP